MTMIQTEQSTQTLEVYSSSKNGVTISKQCAECGKDFSANHGKQQFCGDPCRQSAHRKSPAHRRYLDKQIRRRLLRRNTRTALLVRDKGFNDFGVLSGPAPTSILPIGMMTLPKEIV